MDSPIVNLAMSAVVAPVLVYVGLSRPSTEAPYYAVYGLGILLLSAHLYFLIRKWIAGLGFSTGADKAALINSLVHVCLTGPIMIYVGVMAIHYDAHKFSNRPVSKIAPIAYNALVVLGAATFAFNAYRFVAEIKRDFVAV